ncbi:MAG: alpha/beta hydrolase [Pseudomonadota bacterium]
MMIRNFAAASISLLALCACTSIPAMPAETPYEFEAQNGEKVSAFRGVVKVPENRADPASRTIDVHYVRFPSTSANHGSPIVYLAGGPGGSGVGAARAERFPLFMAMREFGDVIALDQRGTGWSDDTPECVSKVILPVDRVLGRNEEASLLRGAAEECGDFWRKEGFDPAGYTTVENARDLDALRAHLGARKISLLAISYGTHLALAAVKEMGPRIDKMVLTGAEGLDQTVKLPSNTDAYFDRLQEAIDKEPKAKGAYPDVKALMRRVHAKLEAAPPMMSVPTKDGASDMLLTKEVMQLTASASIADPQGAAQLLMLYLAVDAGMIEPVAAALGRFITPGEPESFHLMPLAMDVASGVGAERLARIEKEAETALLGDYLNYPMPQLAGALDLDLGDDFRKKPVSSIPTLLLTGTLDGRTYPDEQRDAVSGLRNLTAIKVVNAGHNLFMVSPEITATIQRFMRGEKIDEKDIIVSAPSLAPSF